MALFDRVNATTSQLLNQSLERSRALGRAAQDRARTQSASQNALYGTMFGSQLAEGFMRGAGLDKEYNAAQEREKAQQEINELLSKAQSSPNGSAYIKQAAAKAATYGFGKEALQLGETALAYEQQENQTQYQDIFRATEQAVREEVDPSKDPIKYNSLLAERLSASRNPLANEAATKYRDQAIEYQIEAAKAKAEQEGYEYDSPEGTEVTSASKFLTSRKEVDENIGKIKEEDLNAASVELASRAKDIQGRENVPYGQALSMAYNGMKQDGTFNFKKDGGFLFFDKFEYLPYGGAVDATQKAPEPSVREVRRKTSDGRTAVFDAETKQFIRYE